MTYFLRNNKPYYYFDYAATAPKVDASLQAMAPYLLAGPGSLSENANPNALSGPGRDAFKALQEARRKLAQSIGAARPDEVLFTSGATEADNAALIGIAKAAFALRNRQMSGTFTPHVITSLLEHEAVIEPARRLEASGFEVTYLRPDKNGFLSAEVLQDTLKPETVLVSIQMANSEIGSIQDIKTLAQTAHENSALFHTDAVQAFGKIPCNVSELDVDAASFSAHKLGGPYGIGALYLRSRTPFEPFLLGGGQERGLRSGTQNVCGALGFAAAAEEALADLELQGARLRALRDKLYERLLSVPGIKCPVSCAPGSQDFLPNIVCVLLEDIESQTAVLRFDSLGFAVSGGSACSSQSLDPSHVLLACGISPDDAQGELRISFGHFTTENDVDALLAAVPQVLHWNK